jgi:hypothetical protein
MEQTKMQFWSQLEKIKNIPGRVIANWPAYFSFALSDYAVAMIVGVTPAIGGPVGTVINYGLVGFRDVAKQVTWEAVRMT